MSRQKVKNTKHGSKFQKQQRKKKAQVAPVDGLKKKHTYDGNDYFI